jgi:signal transduction histidine kinase
MFGNSSAELKPGRQIGGNSLTWALFSSVVLVMIVLFLAVQILRIDSVDPDTAKLTLSQRLDVVRLLREVSDNLPFLGMLAVLMLAGVLAALHLGLRPLRNLSERAVEIGPATITQRLPLQSTPREIAPLVMAFNSALDRLEAGLHAQREFSANAAHELRTPLATLRAQVESLLDPADRKDAIEEFDRLSRLISQLLNLAEADDGADPGEGTFELVGLARNLTRDMAVAIVSGGRGIAFESVHDVWPCHGSAGLVGVAIRNLLENAMRHTPPGSEILVSIDEMGCLIVSDNGPGVPSDFRERLFQRFSKANANGFGAGLGLSIVGRIMLLHRGEARLLPSPVGARFMLDFSSRGLPRSQGAKPRSILSSVARTLEAKRV